MSNINHLIQTKMTGFLDIKSPNFLGGTNVHSLVIIGLLGYIIYKK